MERGGSCASARLIAGVVAGARTARIVRSARRRRPTSPSASKARAKTLVPTTPVPTRLRPVRPRPATTADLLRAPSAARRARARHARRLGRPLGPRLRPAGRADPRRDTDAIGPDEFTRRATGRFWRQRPSTRIGRRLRRSSCRRATRSSSSPTCAGATSRLLHRAAGLRGARGRARPGEPFAVDGDARSRPASTSRPTTRIDQRAARRPARASTAAMRHVDDRRRRQRDACGRSPRRRVRPSCATKARPCAAERPSVCVTDGADGFCGTTKPGDPGAAARRDDRRRRGAAARATAAARRDHRRSPSGQALRARRARRASCAGSVDRRPVRAAHGQAAPDAPPPRPLRVPLGPRARSSGARRCGRGVLRSRSATAPTGATCCPAALEPGRYVLDVIAIDRRVQPRRARARAQPDRVHGPMRRAASSSSRWPAPPPSRGCGVGRGAQRWRRVASRHARLRRDRDRAPSERRAGPGGRDRDAAAAAQLRRRDALRRRLRAVDRRDLSGWRRGSRRSDWFFYVNGIEASEGAARASSSDGDRVWWDHHDWDAAMRVPAVVGSFPEPFRVRQRRPAPAGAAGLRDATRGRRATSVAERLNDGGRARRVAWRRSARRRGCEVLRIVVGPWSEVRRDPTAVLLEEGPRLSGVFARPARDGRSIELLDPRGEVVRTLGARRRADRRDALPGPAADLGRDRRRRGRADARRSRGARARACLEDRFALAVEAPGRGVAAAGGGRSGSDLPAPREPAAGGACDGRARVVPRRRRARRWRSSTRSCSAALLAAVLLAAAAARLGREVRARGAARDPVRAAVSRAINALANRDGLDGARARRRGAGARRTSTSRSRRSSTARASGCASVIVIAVLRAALGGGRPGRAAARVAAASRFAPALTAALATRIVPVLARDARRLADAQRCRPGRAGVAAGDRARGVRRRARPRGRRGGDARGARLRRRARRAPAQRGRGRGTTSRSPRRRSRSCALDRARARRRARSGRRRTRGSTSPLGAGPSLIARGARGVRRCCRSPTAGGSRAR